MKDILSIIRQARERGAKRLNLSDCNLSELPLEIGELADLQVLWLHNNKLAQLPPEIGQLRNLRRIRLHNNELKERLFGNCWNLPDATYKNDLEPPQALFPDDWRPEGQIQKGERNGCQCLLPSRPPYE